MNPRHARVSVLAFALALTCAAPGARAAGAPTPAAAPGGLAAAYKREVALLEAERSALALRLAQVTQDRTARAKAAQRELGGLEAALVLANAANDGAAARIGALEKGGAVNDDDVTAARMSLLRALAAHDLSQAATVDDGLPQAVAALRRAAAVRRVEGSYFDAGGRFVNGTIVELGRAAAVAASPSGGDGAAGPLFAGVDGDGDVRQVSDAALGDAARAFVAGAGPAPLRLAPPAALSAADAAPFSPLGLLVDAAALLLAAAALARLVLLVRARRSTAAALLRAPDLVVTGDLATAEAVCRAARGPAGPLFSTIVAATTRSSDVEDHATDAWLDAAHAVDRGDRWLGAGAVIAALLGVLALVRGVPVASLETAVVAGLAAVVVLASARGAAERLKRDLEKGTLRLIDAARRARTSAA